MNKIIKDEAGNVLVQETRGAFVMPKFTKDVAYSQRKELIKLEMDILKEIHRKFPPVTVDMLLYSNISFALEDVPTDVIQTEEGERLIQKVFLETLRDAPFYDEFNKYKERY